MSIDIFNGIRVLCVEDDEYLAKSIERIMKNLSMQVKMAKDGKEALTILRENKIDIILSDVKMPNMDGITLAEVLRNEENSIPIILISNYEDVKDLKRAIPLQLIDYLTKPISLDKLIESFKKALSRLSEKGKRVKLFENTYYIKKSKSIYFEKEDITTPLGIKEIALLELFIKHRGEYVTLQMIENIVYDGNISYSSLRNAILRLREKLHNKNIIKNYRDLGYMLK